MRASTPGSRWRLSRVVTAVAIGVSTLTVLGTASGQRAAGTDGLSVDVGELHLVESTGHEIPTWLEIAASPDDPATLLVCGMRVTVTRPRRAVGFVMRSDTAAGHHHVGDAKRQQRIKDPVIGHCRVT